jgi:hypothetical protein
MARIEWVKQRLENWALWKARERGGGLGYAAQSSFLIERVDNDRYRESKIPIDEVDAGVTDQAVTALRAALPDLHRTLDGIYVRDWGTQGAMARLGKDRSTIYAQLDQADRWLQAWFIERSARQQAARVAYVAVGR